METVFQTDQNNASKPVRVVIEDTSTGAAVNVEVRDPWVEQLVVASATKAAVAQSNAKSSEAGSQRLMMLSKPPPPSHTTVPEPPADTDRQGRKLWRRRSS